MDVSILQALPSGKCPASPGVRVQRLFYSGTATSQVQIEGVTIAEARFVASNRLEVGCCRGRSCGNLAPIFHAQHAFAPA
jgi:hypothetical protein